jgi:hypothetical protein
VLDQVAGALAIVAFLAILWMLGGKRLAGDARVRYLRTAALVFCLVVLTWRGIQTADAAWRVADTNATDPWSVEIGAFVRDHLPASAVLLCEERKGYEHLTMMFYADRTCYGLRGKPLEEIAR